jgi:hypothetical protein
MGERARVRGCFKIDLDVEALSVPVVCAFFA